jgi:hypothetical protein
MSMVSQRREVHKNAQTQQKKDGKWLIMTESWNGGGQTPNHEDDETKTGIKVVQSLIDPSGPTLRYGTLVVPQRLFRREEAAAIITQKFADLAVLCDFMPQAVVLPREALSAAKRILTREAALAADDDAGEASARGLGVHDLGCGPHGWAIAWGRGFYLHAV